jgi:hypothetical protein
MTDIVTRLQRVVEQTDRNFMLDTTTIFRTDLKDAIAEILRLRQETEQAYARGAQDCWRRIVETPR